MVIQPTKEPTKAPAAAAPATSGNLSNILANLQVNEPSTGKSIAFFYNSDLKLVKINLN